MVAAVISFVVVFVTHSLMKRLRSASAPPLCLHFDVNETIMLGDPAVCACAISPSIQLLVLKLPPSLTVLHPSPLSMMTQGGDSYEDSLHKILAKIAFVRQVEPAARGPGRWSSWTWHDGSPLDPLLRDASAPPPPLLPDAFADPKGCVRFYNVPELKAQFAKCFAAEGSPGVIYRETHEKMRDAMRWPSGVPRDSRLCSDEGYYRFLPAFFHTLVELRRRRRPVSVVVRTFGTDLPHLIAALNAFSTGAHPLFPGLNAPELAIPPERTWIGRYDASDGSFNLRDDPRGELGAAKYAEGGADAPASLPPAFGTEAAMLAELEGEPRGDGLRLSAVQDDYSWWKAAGYRPSAGKPLWLSLARGGGEFRHIFFDDNIHCDPNDSIVAVRARVAAGANAPFTPVSGRGTVALHGAVLRKVPTMMPVQHKDWFLEQIAQCEARIDELRARDIRGAAGGLIEVVGL